MSEEFVSRNEFNGLKQEVQELKIEVAEYNGLLHQIERKIDVISEKLGESDEITLLKLKPIEDRILKIENNISWLWKLCGSVIITGIISSIIKFK